MKCKNGQIKTAGDGVKKLTHRCGNDEEKEEEKDINVYYSKLFFFHISVRGFVFMYSIYRLL